MASTTYMSFLMYKPTSSSSYTNLINIINYPALGGSPELIDITTLADKIFQYEPGIQSGEAMEFDALYDPSNYSTIKALEGTSYTFAVVFGGEESTDGTVTPTGELGVFSFTAKLTVYVTEGEVNGARKMKISLARSSTPVFSTSLTE